MKGQDSDRNTRWKDRQAKARQRMQDRLAQERTRQSEAYAHPELARDNQLAETFESWREEAEAKIGGSAVADAKEGPLVDGAPDLKSLAPVDLANLARMDSDIRHSVVEACFYNLKLLVQLLPDKFAAPGFLDRLEPILSQIPSVRSRLEDYFNAPMGESTVGAIFPKVREAIGLSLDALQKDLSFLERDSIARESAEALAERMPREIDRVMNELARIKQALEACKASAWEVLEQALSIQDRALEEARVEVSLVVEPDARSARLFLDREALLDAFIELIRNALDHGFAGAPEEGRQLKISLGILRDSHKRLAIQFEDNGVGKRASEVPKPGHSGKGMEMVKSVIEKIHGGEFVFSAGQQGALVQVILNM